MTTKELLEALNNKIINGELSSDDLRHIMDVCECEIFNLMATVYEYD